MELRTLRGRGLNEPARVWKTTKDMQLLSPKRWWQNSGEQFERWAVREQGGDQGGFTNHTPLYRGAISSQDSLESQP